MRKSFVNNQTPVLAGVVRERTVREAIAQIRNCECHGATAIDLHLSCLNEEFKTTKSIRQIVDACGRPVLALNYNQNYECEKYDTPEEDRIGLLLKAVEAGAAAVDLQGYTYDLSSKYHFRQEFSGLQYSFIQGDPCEVVVDEKVIEKQMELIDKIHAMGAEVLLSAHPGISMSTKQVVELALFLEKRKPDIIKIVTVCNTEEELDEAFGTMLALKREVKTRIHYHCSGKMGKATRILHPLMGSFLIFCSDGYNAGSNFEQLDLQTARAVVDQYRRLLC